MGHPRVLTPGAVGREAMPGVRRLRSERLADPERGPAALGAPGRPAPAPRPGGSSRGPRSHTGTRMCLLDEKSGSEAKI